MALNDMYRVTITGTHGGNNAQLVQHFIATTNGGTAAGLAASIRDKFLLEITRIQGNVYHHRNITVETRVPLGVDSVSLNIDDPGDETQGGVVFPPVAFLFTMRTGLVGRSRRGRMYVPGFPTPWTTSNGNFQGNGITTVASVVTNLFNAYCSGGNASQNYLWGVYSRKLNSFSGFTSLSTSGQLAYQRRRKIGVGF